MLLLDLDPQAHLTCSFGIKTHELEKTIFELLKGEATLDQVIQTVGNLHVVPSTLDLSGAEIELSTVAGSEMLLRDALKKARDYDYILIDCPPNLGLLTLNTLTTAKEVFICVRTMIRDNVALAEAPIKGTTIFDYAPRSYGAEDYLELCKEIIKQG